MIKTKTETEQTIGAVEYLGRKNVFLIPSFSQPDRRHIMVYRKEGSVCSCDGFQMAGACWHTRLANLILKTR